MFLIEGDINYLLVCAMLLNIFGSSCSISFPLILGRSSLFLNNLVDLSESSSNKISAGTGDGNADNWEGDNSESVLESLAISSLMVESCFDRSRRGDFLVDDSGVKGAPFLFRYLFGSLMTFCWTPSCLEDQDSLTKNS